VSRPIFHGGWLESKQASGLLYKVVVVVVDVDDVVVIDDDDDYC